VVPNFSKVNTFTQQQREDEVTVFVIVFVVICRRHKGWLWFIHAQTYLKPCLSIQVYNRSLVSQYHNRGCNSLDSFATR